MTLTLRPTGLASPAFAHLKDWCVLENGEDVGRISEVHAPTRPELAWSWSVTLMGLARGHVRTDGNAPTLEQAKADFRASLEAFRAWR